MNFDFEHDLDRRGTNSIKWDLYGEDVLPMWVADMEFAVPPAVTEAIRRRLDHPIFGYQIDAPSLRGVIAERMAQRYSWDVNPDWVVILSGLVNGLNLVIYSTTASGDAVLFMPPIYPPFMRACQNFERPIQYVNLVPVSDRHTLRYELDREALAAAITPHTRLLMLCNPHNPVGRVFTRAELEFIAELCERDDLLICSDEIHSDLVFTGYRHIPIASLSPEIERRTVTLLAASKTFNMPGLVCSAAIVPDEKLRARLKDVAHGFGILPNAFGYVATEAAYREGQPWLDALLAHLEKNRDSVVDFVETRMPQISATRPEGTYLTWLDCRALGLENPQRFFLEQAKVGLNDGVPFGPGGQGFLRLNFGCSQDMLMKALSKMVEQLENRE